LVTPDESRGPLREPALNAPAIILVLIAAFLAVHLYVTQWASQEDAGWFIAHMAFIPLRLQAGFRAENWPLATSGFSYALLHGSWTHLAVNSFWLLAFGSPLAGRIGTLRFLLFFIVTALAAALLHGFLHLDDVRPLVGASGAVSGMTAAAARFGFRTLRGREESSYSGPPMSVAATLSHPPALLFIGVWFAINALGAFSMPGSGGGSVAWEAHIGGFLAGLFMLGLFDRRR
jgi:membrane associated rhomboid family serine protease